jgi:uncharacterized protein (UPF0216 family)
MRDILKTLLTKKLYMKFSVDVVLNIDGTANTHVTFQGDPEVVAGCIAETMEKNQQLAEMIVRAARTYEMQHVTGGVKN